MGTFAQYRIAEELSRGGIGVVYRAFDPTGAPVALKLLQAGGALDVARFQRECELLTRLRHPGIVGVHDFGFAQGQAYLVMDLVEGRSFEALLRDGPLPPERAVALVEQAAVALEHAHRQGVIHRDVKPANLILRDDGRVVLVDFGLAVLAEVKDDRLTRTGELLGTPLYMAPEQAGGAKDADARADVYGLGATLFALVAGRAPFGGASAFEVLERVVVEPAPPLRSLAPGAPAWLEAVCARCLEKDPELRYPSAAALGSALRATPRPGARTSARYARWFALSALLLCGAVGGWLLASREEPPPAPEPPQAQPEEVRPRATAEHVLEFSLGPRCGHDATVNGWMLYCNDNYGADDSLIVGARETQGRRAERVSYLRFPLDRLPADAQVEEATLVLTRCSKESPEGLVAHEVLDPWVEGTSTHDEWVDGVAWGAGQGHSPLPDRFKRPAWDSEEAAEATPVPGEALAHRFVITALLQRWSRARGSNHGVVVRLRSPRSSAAGVYYGFRSRECPYVNERPRVRIRYRGSPPLPEPAAAALPPPDRESLPALTAYLRQAPDDVEVRLARATLYARQRVFSQSWQDLETCLGLRLPEDPHPGISYAALGIFRRLHAEYQAPTVTEEEFRKFPKPATVLDVVWRGLTPETAPAETIPSREERRWVIRSRIGYHPEVKYLVGLWRGAQQLWPDDPELRYEVAETVLDELERRVGYAGGESATAFTRGQLESLLATDERSLSPGLRARGEVLLDRLGGR